MSHLQLNPSPLPQAGGLVVRRTREFEALSHPFLAVQPRAEGLPSEPEAPPL